jgi:hypothetical protein
VHDFKKLRVLERPARSVAAAAIAMRSGSVIGGSGMMPTTPTGSRPTLIGKQTSPTSSEAFVSPSACRAALSHSVTDRLAMTISGRHCPLLRAIAQAPRPSATIGRCLFAAAATAS